VPKKNSKEDEVELAFKNFGIHWKKIKMHYTYF